MIISYEVRNKIIKDHFINILFSVLIYFFMYFVLHKLDSLLTAIGTLIIYFVINFYNPKRYMLDITTKGDVLEINYLTSYLRVKTESIKINDIKVIKLPKKSFFGVSNEVVFYLDFLIETFVLESVKSHNQIVAFIKKYQIKIK